MPADIYVYLLVAHNWWRWVVVLAGAAAVVSAGSGLASRAEWSGWSPKLGRLFGVAVDIQFLMGAALYLVFSPLTTVAMAGGATADNPDMSFFGTYHGVVMTIAFIDVHVCAVVIRRGASALAKQRRAVLLYGQTLLLILAAIPWGRPLLRL